MLLLCLPACPLLDPSLCRLAWEQTASIKSWLWGASSQGSEFHGSAKASLRDFRQHYVLPSPSPFCIMKNFYK